MRLYLGVFLILGCIALPQTEICAQNLGPQTPARWKGTTSWKNSVVVSRLSFEWKPLEVVMEAIHPTEGREVTVPRGSLSLPWVRLGPMVLDLEFRRFLQPQSLTPSLIGLPSFPGTMPFDDYQKQRWGGVITLPGKGHLGLLTELKSDKDPTIFGLGKGTLFLGEKGTEVQLLGGSIVNIGDLWSLGGGVGIQGGVLGPWFGWAGGGFRYNLLSGPLDQVWWSGIVGRVRRQEKASSGQVWAGEFLLIYQGARIHPDLFWSAEGVGLGTLNFGSKKLEAKTVLGLYHNQKDTFLEGSGSVTFTEKRQSGSLSVRGMVNGRSLPFEVPSLGGSQFSRMTYSLEPKLSILFGSRTLTLGILGELAVEGEGGTVPSIEKKRLVHTLSTKGPLIGASFVVDQHLRDLRVWELKGRAQVDFETELPGGVLGWSLGLEQTDYLEAQWYRGVTLGSYLRGPAMGLTQIRGEVSFRSSPQPE